MNDYILSNNKLCELYKQHSDMVYRLSVQNIRNTSEAEDITQDVFTKLIINRDNFESDEHVKAWLIRVTINQCNDYLKSHRFKRRSALNENNILSTNKFEHTEDERMVLEQLQLLPVNYRNVLYLYFFEEYTVPEIAIIMNKKPNTVFSWLRRAKEKFKVNWLELEKESEA